MYPSAHTHSTPPARWRHTVLFAHRAQSDFEPPALILVAVVVVVIVVKAVVVVVVAMPVVAVGVVTFFSSSLISQRSPV